VQAAGPLPEGHPLVYAGDGVSDRCAARAADRVFARGWLADDLGASGLPHERFETLADVCCCAFLSRTTSRFRPSASACSGRDLANLWLDGALHRVIGGREVRIAAVPGGVDVEPLDGETRAGVEKLLGREFELEPFTAWAAEQPVLSGIVASAPGLPPAARTRPLREPRHVDHGAAGVA